jgi:hypothetical protein
MCVMLRNFDVARVQSSVMADGATSATLSDSRGCPMAAADTQLMYSVTAAMADSLKAEYIAWLNDGHIQTVVDDGKARSARVVDLGSEDGTSKVCSIYVFRSKAAYDEYDARVAPGLRADGKARFIDNPDKQVVFSRAFENISAAKANEVVGEKGSYTGAE